MTETKKKVIVEPSGKLKEMIDHMESYAKEAVAAAPEIQNVLELDESLEAVFSPKQIQQSTEASGIEVITYGAEDLGGPYGNSSTAVKLLDEVTSDVAKAVDSINSNNQDAYTLQTDAKTKDNLNKISEIFNKQDRAHHGDGGREYVYEREINGTLLDAFMNSVEVTKGDTKLMNKTTAGVICTIIRRSGFKVKTVDIESNEKHTGIYPFDAPDQSGSGSARMMFDLEYSAAGRSVPISIVYERNLLTGANTVRVGGFGLPGGEQSKEGSGLYMETYDFKHSTGPDIKESVLLAIQEFFDFFNNKKSNFNKNRPTPDFLK
jgi:hypothetical protein